MQFSHQMPLHFFYTNGVKKSKMTKNSNQGGFRGFALSKTILQFSAQNKGISSEHSLQRVLFSREREKSKLPEET